MKLAVNAVIFGLNEALAEGLVLAERNGIDRALAYDVLAASAVGAPFVGYKRAAFLEPDSTPVAFALALAAKDARLVAAAAERHAADLPIAEAIAQRFTQATEAGHGEEDMAATYRLSKPG